MKIKKLNNANKIIAGVKMALIILMVILIYIVSPKITVNVQNCAKWLYELDGTYITRVIELILAQTYEKFFYFCPCRYNNYKRNFSEPFQTRFHAVRYGRFPRGGPD